MIDSNIRYGAEPNYTMMEGMKCAYQPGIKMVLFSKKGMATKAFKNNLATENVERLKNKIKKGTVKVYKP